VPCVGALLQAFTQEAAYRLELATLSQLATKSHAERYVVKVKAHGVVPYTDPATHAAGHYFVLCTELGRTRYVHWPTRLCRTSRERGC